MAFQLNDTLILSRAGTLYRELVSALAALLYTNPVLTGVVYQTQPAPTAKSATGTVTIAELLTKIFTITGTAAISLTLPTGTLSDAGILAGALPVNGSFDWSIINNGTSAAAVTILAGTGHTLVGPAVTPITTASYWRTRKTAANTFVTYRIG